MALDQTRPTLLDIAKMADPDGKPAQVLEILNQTNLILPDAPAYPSNAPVGHRVTMRTSLPTAAFTKLNKGVVRSKGTTEQRTDPIGMIAGLSEVDAKLEAIVGASAFAAERQLQDAGFMESMSQLVANTMLYGDTKTNEASFDGLAPRLATEQTSSLLLSQVRKLHASTQPNGDGTSLYIVDWGERGAHIIYPQNSTAASLTLRCTLSIPGEENSGERSASLHELVRKQSVDVGHLRILKCHLKFIK